MEFLSRESVLQELNDSLEQMMTKYNLDDVGIYEEEGANEEFFLGFTVRKNGKVYMINEPYVKDEKGNIAIKEKTWTIQTDQGKEAKGFDSLDEVFQHIQQNHLH